MKNNNGQVFNQLIQDISAGDIPNVLLLFGEEAFLTDWAEGQLVKRYVTEAAKALDLTKFEPGSLKTDDLIGACETMPMFSERKVVVVSSASDIDKDAEAYIRTVPDTCLLIIKGVDEKSGKDAKKLSKSLKGVCGVYEFGPISERELKQFIAKRFRAAGKSISPAAAALLISNCGYMNKEIDYALYNLENDIRKMIAYSGSDVITEEDVMAGLSDNIEHNVFKMLHEMILSGSNEHRILATIAGQLELMLQARQMSEKGMSKKQISSKLKVHEFRVEKAMKFARRYDERDLVRMLGSAFDTDEKIKSGLLDAGLALEMLIAGI